MSSAQKALYDTDFAEWRTVTADLIRAGRFDEIDAAHLAEEIEDLGKSERRELHNRIARIMEHALMLSLMEGPLLDQNRRGWLASIGRQQRELRDLFHDSPSLRAGLTQSTLQHCYQKAVEDVTREYDLKPPALCPFDWGDVLPPMSSRGPAKKVKKTKGVV